MRPSLSLDKLRVRIEGRLLRIRRLYKLGRASANIDYSSELLAVSAIELDNLVVSAMRCLIISSLFSARTVSGVRVTNCRNFAGEEEVGAFILSTINSAKYIKRGQPLTVARVDEPTIRHPREVRRILVAAKSSNLPSVDQAMALNTDVFDNLATVRNFYAHRNADTWRKLKNKALAAGVFSISSPGDYLHAALPSLPISIMENWMDDVSLFFDFALR